LNLTSPCAMGRTSFIGRIGIDDTETKKVSIKDTIQKNNPRFTLTKREAKWFDN